MSCETVVQKQMESFAWDTDTRHGLLPDAGAEVEVHEFDFAKTGVVYEKNGVVIKSFPAIHIYDGPVSLRLEWNGLCFVFSGDTTPSQFFVDNAKGADLLVHEAFKKCFMPYFGSGPDGPYITSGFDRPPAQLPIHTCAKSPT